LDTGQVFEILSGLPIVGELKKKFGSLYPNVFVGIIILHPNDPTRVLVVDYKPDRGRPRVDIKFPGGTGDANDANPFGTFSRECKAEVLGATPEALVTDIFPICREVRPARSDAESDHIRYAVVARVDVPIVAYTIREGRHEDEKGRISDEEISNHRYVPVDELARKIFPGHRGFLRALCEILAPYIPEYGWALQELDRAH